MPRPTLALLGMLAGAGGVALSIWTALVCLAGGRRGVELLLALDQVLNAATGGSHREYLSTRAAKAALQGKAWGVWLCAVLDHIDPGHSDRALKE